MRKIYETLACLFLTQAICVAGFVIPIRERGIRGLGSSRQTSALARNHAASSASEEIPTYSQKKKKTLRDFRKEGGLLTFNTPIGALNPFAIYYGLMSLFLGIPWLIALKASQFLYWITGGRFDKKVRAEHEDAALFSVLQSDSLLPLRDVYQFFSAMSGVWL